MTKKQQLKEYELRNERKERLAKGEDVIIFDEKVILRENYPNFDPSKQRNQNTTKSQDVLNSQSQA